MIPPIVGDVAIIAPIRVVPLLHLSVPSAYSFALGGYANRNALEPTFGKSLGDVPKIAASLKGKDVLTQLRSWRFTIS